jgi:flagellin-like hook-associated protein FlgL
MRVTPDFSCDIRDDAVRAMREVNMEGSFLSSSARTSVQTLKKFSIQLSKTSERLATGLKVNRASDNPIAFFTAKSLSQRAGDLNRVLDSISTTLGSVRSAEIGIRSLERLVQVAQSIVNTASSLPLGNPTATGSVDVSAQSDVTALAGVSDGDQFSVQAGSEAAVTITINSGDTPDQLLAQINAVDNVTASFTSAGELQISTTNSENLTLTEVTGTPLSGLGISAGAFDQTSANSPERAALAVAYDEVRTQINQLAEDSSFLGINLLTGSSPVLNFNESGTSSLTLSGVDATASGLGISASANGFQSNSNISAARGELRGAVNSLRSFSSRLSVELSVATTRSDFTAKLRNTLQTGAAKLTLSDPNEEGAKLLALQTRTSLAAASFSIVQKSENSILKLFS